MALKYVSRIELGFAADALFNPDRQAADVSHLGSMSRHHVTQPIKFLN